MQKPLLILLLSLFSAGSATAWKVEGRLSGVTGRDTVLVSCHQFFGNYGKRIGLDTLPSDGRFTFSGHHPQGALILMSVSSGDLSYALWVTDSSEIRVSGAAGGPWSIVSNEPEQAVQAEIESVDLSDLRALMDGRENRAKYRDTVYRTSVDRLWPVCRKYPNSRAMLDNLNFYVGAGFVSSDKLRWLSARLDSASRESICGKAIALALETAARVPKVGEPYSDVAVTDPSGASRRLSDYVGHGRYVLLDFWSSGCKGCLAAFPRLKELYAAHRDRLVILGVNYDTDRRMWSKAVEKWALPWPQISDGMGFSGPVNARYKVTVEPTYLLIAPDGQIVARWDGSTDDMASRLPGLLGEQPSND